jgi:hypothetical protein
VILFFSFQDRVLLTICLGLTSNLNPPDFCLLSSWDYRCEPLCPASFFVFKAKGYLVVSRQFISHLSFLHLFECWVWISSNSCIYLSL